MLYMSVINVQTHANRCDKDTPDVTLLTKGARNNVTIETCYVTNLKLCDVTLCDKLPTLKLPVKDWE